MTNEQTIRELIDSGKRATEALGAASAACYVAAAAADTSSYPEKAGVETAWLKRMRAIDEMIANMRGDFSDDGGTLSE